MVEHEFGNHGFEIGDVGVVLARLGLLRANLVVHALEFKVEFAGAKLEVVVNFDKVFW